MPDLNYVSLLGTVSRDAQVRQLRAGGHVAGLALSVVEPAYGDREPETCLIDVLGFGRTVDELRDLKAGDTVLVVGTLSYRRWEDQQGQRRSKHEVIARRVQRLTGEGRPAAAPTAKPPRPAPRPSRPSDEEVPF
jgi:single-strand DNA-binding protein